MTLRKATSQEAVRSSSSVIKKSEHKISVGDVQYYLVPNGKVVLCFISRFFPLPAALAAHTPTLILAYSVTPGQAITRSALREFRSRRLDHDDVFQAAFFENFVFYGASKEELYREAGAGNELESWGMKNVAFIPCHSSAKVPSVSIEDSQSGLNKKVIVPSRCYFNPSPSRPLDGIRISVKDSIDIAGHKTTLCNRAWMDLYPRKEKHAACVETFLKAGAIIVGKVKLQAMIMREEPLECVEFTAPFNPRADGYQVPSGSSHASAAGISSYDWLDFSIGSDTNGSGRKPASYNGCFSIRPSTGIMDTNGVVAFFPEFDMPVFFGRDISKFPHFISAWYGESPLLRKPSKTRVEILYPVDFLPTSNPAQSHLIEKFVTGLELALQTKRTKICLAQLWKEDRPDGEEHDGIAKYLDTAGIYPFYYDQYHNLADFRSEYKKKHGKPPFVHRALRWQWVVAKTISKAERDECLRRCQVYAAWLLKRVFDAGSQGSIKVMVLPIESGQPNYRDSPLPPYSLLSGFNPLHMPPIMRAPEVTAPVGDIPYQSIVSEREEPLPIAISLIGPPGTDLILPELVKKGLKGAGLPVEVKTGRSMF
ncbi:amidase [Lophiostoma macrostomum CBS 122681]|uniref:Amidase n=1 Tax=Lophiostoma macrostomum CBS 122681 TaxID=1314788 RepID=A0A6A6T2B5_9PLEO|nr:amidase [Lophiostoma macrostomum CBS 122681]